ncbi:hypothetical protein ACROYT_G003130 [Oculina patagonica]
MSLLRWKELAKSKSDLGDKINYVKNAITQNNIGQQTSQESLAKVFKPVTSKLDEVIESNLQIPKVPKKRVKKGMKGEQEGPDYAPEVDPFEEMDVDNIFEPQQQKQIPKQPPRYSDVFGKEGPDYETFTEDEIVEAESEEDADDDIEVEDESEDEITPEDFYLPSIDDIKTKLVDKKNKTTYLKSIIAQATHERNRLKGFKASNTKKLSAKKISAKEAKETGDQLDNSNKVLTAYINDNKKLLQTIQKKGSGIRRKHRGGNVIFFSDVNQLLKILELIIGETMAGNTTSEYLQRYELVRFQLDDVIRVPANGQHQLKNGYKFTINDRSSFYDWYNAYFEVQFQVQMLADGATTGAHRITVINGAHSLIAHMMIKSAGKIVYDTDNLHKVTFVKNLLEYSDDFSRSVAKNSLWYLDTDHRIANANQNAGFEARRLLTTGLNDVNVVIPLNRYSFFEELEGRMLLPMQLQFNIQLQNDAELLKKADDVADGRVVLNRFLLWVPKLTPKDSLYDKFVSSFLVKNTWTYMREMYEVSAPTNSSGFFQISSSIDNVKAIFVYLQRAKSNNADENPYEFDTYNINLDRGNGSYLTTCRLEYGNGVFYPETEYDSESKVRIFNDLMSYGMRKNDYNSGTQLNLANYNSLYSIIFFDLSYQAERVTRDPKQLIFRYKLNANSAGDSPFNVHAIVLYDETIVIDKVHSLIDTSFILACAPENSAADLLAERLLDHVDKGKLFRMYASSRPWDFVPQKLKDARVVNFDPVLHDVFYPSKEELMSNYRVIVTTLVTAGRLVSAMFPRTHFTHIFIDEAGHATEPECIIPVADLLDPNNPRGGQLVLAGDPKQLGPILRSPITQKYGLETSLLERLMTSCAAYSRGLKGSYNSNLLTKLVNNYRSHRTIIEIPKQLFYDNELHECAGDFRNVMLGWEELPNKDFPIIFHPVFGKDEREGSSPSFFNVAEVETIERYLKKLLDDNVRSRGLKHLRPEMIGVISPYKRQVQKIQKMIEKRRFGAGIKVGSVEEFQGQERRVIILSTVRSTKKEYLEMDKDFHLGFLNNPKRFNVAITRAQALLILIGNPDMLRLDENWRRFLEYCGTNNATVEVGRKEKVEDIADTLRRLNLYSAASSEFDEDSEISQRQLQEHPEWTRHE